MFSSVEQIFSFQYFLEIENNKVINTNDNGNT